MSASRLRVGVLGGGYWGANIVRTCSELGVLRAVCDTDETALARVSLAYPGVALARTLETMLPHVDAVIIATPAVCHAEHALRAIAAGKHVLVEKPLALTVADAERIVDAAERRGVALSVGHVVLYDPGVRALLRELASGSIGELFHVRSRRLNLGKLREHESVWWSFAPHDVALMLHVVRELPERMVSAQHAVRRSGVYDFAYADFAFPGGRSAHIEVGWLESERVASFDAFGSRGVLRLDMRAKQPSVVRVPCGAVDADGAGTATWRNEAVTIPIEPGEPLALEIEAFLEAAASGRATITDGRAGLDVVRVLAETERNLITPAPIAPEVFA